MTILKASSSDLLDNLVREQSEQTVGNRNTELFRRTRVALEAGYEPEEVRERMTAAGRASGLDHHEVKPTINSALRTERIERLPDGMPPLPPEQWAKVWETRHPRLIAIAADKRPMQRWQYPFTDPNDAIKEGGPYFAVVLPPGVLVLDIDNGAEFEKAEGGALFDAVRASGAPSYKSISGQPGKAHTWFRAHPDRPYPSRTMNAWPGADLLVGGMGIANIANLSVLDTIGPIHELPLAPDWMQPADTEFPTITSLIETWDSAKDVFTVERLLRPGYRVLLAAYEGVGKTYIGIQMALCFAYPDQSGALFGEFEVNEPLTVLYVDGEVGDGEFIRRSQALARDLGVKLGDGQNFRPLTLDRRALHLKNEADLTFMGKAADRAHEQTGRKVVLFLDSADSLYGKGLAGPEAEEFDAAIAQLHEGRRDWLITVTLVHTVKKPRENRASYKVDLQSVLGNVTRQADAVIVLDTKDTEYALRIDVYKRPGRSAGVLQRDEDENAWTWTANVGEQGPVAWKVPMLDVLARMDAGRVGARWTAQRLATSLKVTKTTARGYLEYMALHGHVLFEPMERGKVKYIEYWAAPKGAEDDA